LEATIKVQEISTKFIDTCNNTTQALDHTYMGLSVAIFSDRLTKWSTSIQALYRISACMQITVYICLQADYCIFACTEIIMYLPASRLSCIYLQADDKVSACRQIIVYLPAGRLL